MSITIGICSNSIGDIGAIKGALRHEFSGIEHSYTLDYINADKFMGNNIPSIDSIDYDVLFIDLDFKGYNMLEILADVSKKYPLADIILMSSQHDLVFEAIKYRPFRFIRRAFLTTELPEAVSAVVSKIVEESILYNAGHEHESAKVRIMDVDYIESKGHYLNFYTDEGDVQLRGKISDYEEKLAAYGFIRVHRGYLANIRCINGFDSKQISMNNGKTLPVSRKNSDTIKQQYDKFVKKFVRGIY